MIDLSTWNLTIPVGTPATTIATPTLLSGYRSSFFKPDGTTVAFWSPVSGGHTVNAKYPRSEFRETYPDGSLRNWKYQEADNYLRAALMVSQVPSTGKVVIGQIHTYQSVNPLLKLVYVWKDNTGSVVASIRMTPDDVAQKIVISEGVPLGQRFNYTIHLTPSGNLSVRAAGNRIVTRIDPSWANKLQYFKAGVYTQDNVGYATEGGGATFFRLAASHAPLCGGAICKKI